MEDKNFNFQRINEVKFSNHIYEFIQFYNNHKNFCDEISGIKERTMIEDNVEKKFYINPSNFSFAIKRVNAFVIAYSNYITDAEDKVEIERRVKELDDKFNSDYEYQKLASKSSRTSEQEYYLYKSYLSYLFDCYKIGNFLYKLLQSSLMIGTSDIKKAISYYNDTAFFERLSLYRYEVSDDLANFKLRNTLEHLKKIVGYYYSYCLFISPNDADRIDRIIDLLIEYCFDPELTRLISKLQNKQALGNTEIEIIRDETSKVKYVLSKIYYITNVSLSRKNILPKVKKRVDIDTTLI